MLEFTSADVVARGVKLHFYRTGGAKPPLVLVHGITDDGLCWMPVAEVLAANHDVIMVDLRGHGKSEAPDYGYTRENLAHELADLILKLGVEKPILLGHSMGAATSLLLAALYPDLPGAILLEDPPPFWWQNPAAAQDTSRKNGLADWIAGNKRKTNAELIAEGRGNAAWSEAELEPWVNSKQRYSPKIVELVHAQMAVSTDFPNLMKQITCPAVIISADKQLGAASSPEDIAALKAWVPQLQTAHIPGAGHNIRREQFARYMEVVQQALRDIEK